LMADFFEGKEISLDVLKATLRKAVIKNEIFPVYAGSALKNKGVQLVLDAVVDFLPSPVDIAAVKGIDPKTDAIVERRPSDSEPFTALAFKLQTDPFVGQLVFFRVYSGMIQAGSYLYNSTTGERERVGRMVRLQADKREEIKTVYSGEIAAIIGLKDTKTSHTLCDEVNQIILEKIKFPEPVISLHVEPKTKADQERMGLALKKLSDEDPTFRISTNEETTETIISGMGELHLDIIVDRMKREFKVNVNVGNPQVAYRETIKNPAMAEGKYIKQSGGRGQYGHIEIEVEPLATADFEFVDKIKGGTVPREYIPAIQKGIKEALDRGVLAGYPVKNIKVTLLDGSYHEVDSSEMAFKIAGSIAIQAAVKKADLVIMEPIMSVEVTTPEKFLGEITGDLNSRRGQIGDVIDRGNNKVIKAMVPLSSMFGYATTIRSVSEGRASYTMEFNKYEEVPRHITQEIVEGKKK